MSLFNQFKDQFKDQIKNKAKLVVEVLRGDGSRVPLELRQLMLSALEERILPREAGRRMFPYTSIKVRLFASDDHQAGVFNQVFVEEDAFKKAVIEHLRPPRCEKPKITHFEVHIEVTEQAEQLKAGFQFELTGQKKESARWRLRVLTGTATPVELVIEKPLSNVGRTEEIYDKNGDLVRRNDLVFAAEGDEQTMSVSRVHAHLIWDRRSGDLQIQDDNSQYGTHILRQNGPSIKVPTALPAKLYPGDQIIIGKAKIKVEQLEN